MDGDIMEVSISGVGALANTVSRPGFPRAAAAEL